MKRVRVSSKASRARQAGSHGFTLIEVLIALALFAIIAIVFAGGLSTASRAVTIADIRTRAESLARTQMEYVKEQGYEKAPDGGVHLYAKISGIPEGYEICSLNLTTGVPAECAYTDSVIGWPWDSAGNTTAESDDGLQKITLVIKHEEREILTLEGYKVYR
jgi:prepilin-type N-terminal cleavage/methylation domain-containing protein